MLVLYFFWLLALLAKFCHGASCSEDSCQLPSCQCATSNENPTLLDDIEVPQFVLLTFIGNVAKETLNPIRSILNSTFRNPNKCPISSTFFIHETHTDYCLVQQLFDNHHEIAVTTSSSKCLLNKCNDESDLHDWTTEHWRERIQQPRRNIIEISQIHQSHIKGFRVAHLQIDENKHLDFLQHYNFHYDSSMLFKSSSLIWPFTLDYPFNETDCTNCHAWTKSFPALWQFPLHEWAYPKSKRSCRTLLDSSCLPTKKAHTVDVYLRFLKYNLERHASLMIGHRSPFIIQLDLSQLSQPDNVQLQALIQFIEYVLNSPTHRYVYFVSIEKALEWLKFPRTIAELPRFWAFRCADKTNDYREHCSATEFNGNEQQHNIRMQNTDALNENRSESVTFQTEKLFPNRIVLHCLWIFFIMVIVVFFYDKYFMNN